MLLSRRLRRLPGMTMLIAGLVLIAVGVGVIAIGAVLTSAEQVPERSTTGLVLSVGNCYRSRCLYYVSYTAGGQPEIVSITGTTADPPAGSKAQIFYQRSHPDEARFPDTDYASEQGTDGLVGMGVIAMLAGLVTGAAGLAKLVTGRLRTRRARAARTPGFPL